MFRSLVVTASQRTRVATAACVASCSSVATSVVSSALAPRSFHSARSLRGWAQRITFGPGLPAKLSDVDRLDAPSTAVPDQPAPSPRVARIVIPLAAHRFRVELDWSHGAIIDPQLNPAWMQHDSSKHGRVLLFDRTLHHAVESGRILPSDELLGPFDSFDQMATEIGLDQTFWDDHWSKTDKTLPYAIGSIQFEKAIGLERSEDERKLFPYAWWAAASE